jgi:hypothetical protein
VVQFPARTRDEFLLHKVQTGFGAISASCTMGTAQDREADNSPSSSAEVRNGGTIPPLPSRSLCHGA